MLVFGHVAPVGNFYVSFSPLSTPATVHAETTPATWLLHQRTLALPLVLILFALASSVSVLLSQVLICLCTLKAQTQGSVTPSKCQCSHHHRPTRK